MDRSKLIIVIIICIGLFFLFKEQETIIDDDFEIKSMSLINEILHHKEGNLAWMFGSETVFMRDYFLVSGFINDSIHQRKIDSFVCNNWNKEFWNRTHSYTMTFLKKSEITNEEYLKDNPKYFDWHTTDNDILFVYTFRCSGYGEVLSLRKKTYLGGKIYFKYEKMKCSQHFDN